MIPIYVAITSHGFGHATRTAAVFNRLIQLNPEILPIFVTSTPHWVLDKYLQGRFLHRQRRLDLGVLQSDGLTMDLDATLVALKELQQRADSIIAAEVEFIRTNRACLVYGDIPPLAVAIAEAAGIPCWMGSNFGWDFIYRAYGEPFQSITTWIEDLYSRCQRLFQLPMHEPMLHFPVREPVGLIGADPILPADHVREELGLDPQRPTVLLSFGGFGIDNIPYDQLQRFSDWQFLTFDHDAPEIPNLQRVDGQQWRPVDVMVVCDQVISKPGFGTISEALRVGIPMCCITRQGFAESDLLIDGLKRFGTHRIVPQAVFFEQSWDFLLDPFEEPSAPETLDPHGNQTIAQALMEFTSGS